MALSLLTPWISSAPLDPAKARARFRGGAYTDAQVDQFLASLHHHAETTGMATAALAAQVAKETGSFRFGGQVQPGQFNFAGVGSTNDGAAGHSFGSINAGVMGLLAHHGSYIFGALDNWPPAWGPYKAFAIRNAQVLALVIDGEHVAGTVRMIGDMVNGVWAWTKNIPLGSLNNGYARGIVEIGNTLLGGTTVAQIADRAYLDWSGGNRPRTPLKGFHAVVAHETANEKAGANAEMHRAYATGPSEGGGASYHLVADKVESIQLLTLAEVGYHIGDGANDADDEAFFTVGGEICVNDRAGYPAACRNMAQAFARVLKEKNRPVIDGVTLRQHGSYWSANRNPDVHQGCPQHLKARDWGVSWPQFVGMVTEELEALNLGPAPVGEAANQRLLLDTVAREYPGDEAARYLGALVREGKLLARAAGFGQSDVERVAIYQKGALHTLGGFVYAFFDEAAAAVDPALAPATVAGLMANGWIVLYS